MSWTMDLKHRKSSFKNRCSGLKKKIHELSTLCDIDSCMIVYSTDETTKAPEIYPQDPAVVRAMIKRYTQRSQSLETTTHPIQKNWDDRLKEIPDQELKAHICAINTKMELIQSRIQMLQSSKPNFCTMRASPTCSVDDYIFPQNGRL